MARVTPQQSNLDAVGLAVAKAAQDAVSPDTVIPFDSRASGDHRSDSDVDLMAAANGKALTNMTTARNAAKAYFEAPRRNWVSTVRVRRS